MGSSLVPCPSQIAPQTPTDTDPPLHVISPNHLDDSEYDPSGGTAFAISLTTGRNGTTI